MMKISEDTISFSVFYRKVKNPEAKSILRRELFARWTGLDCCWIFKHSYGDMERGPATASFSFHCSLAFG